MCIVEHLSSKFRRKERVSKMWMGICYLLYYEHVSAALWFVAERNCLSGQFRRKICSKILMAVATCFLFSMTGVSAGTGVDGRQVNCELPKCFEFDDTSMGVSG